MLMAYIPRFHAPRPRTAQGCLLTGRFRRRKSATTSKKGKCGNPRRRPKEIGSVRELAKQYTEAAIDTLAKII
jgi:hypothetical protein